MHKILPIATVHPEGFVTVLQGCFGRFVLYLEVDDEDHGSEARGACLVEGAHVSRGRV